MSIFLNDVRISSYCGQLDGIGFDQIQPKSDVIMLFAILLCSSGIDAQKIRRAVNLL